MAFMTNAQYDRCHTIEGFWANAWRLILVESSISSGLSDKCDEGQR
jgi:hypothetical protein